jgi:hypothetical protein
MWIRPTALAALLLATAGTPAGAQFLDAPREYAKAIVEATTPRWEGQVVPWPTPRPRPVPAPHTLRSMERPLSVHLAPDVPPERGEAALAALEAAALWLDHAGWPGPLPDGGRGGTDGFDLYLTPLVNGMAEAFADAPVPWAHYDAVSAHAVVDPATPPEALAACATEAYLQAILLGQDPAEAPPWRRATATFAAWLVTGEWGCSNDVAEAQRHPWRSWVNGAEDGGGALFLAMLSDRMDGGRGTFVRDLWQLSRQRSTGTDLLRGTPDTWQAIDLILDASGVPLRETLVDLAIARYFAGTRRTHAPFPSLREAGPHATVPHHWGARWAALPSRSPPADPPLEPTGSAHTVVDVADAPEGSVLRVWLRGEYGVRWSLTAVRLDINGAPLSRMSAPAREVPQAYLPVELTQDTHQVLLVVTNLSSRLPDADLLDENIRSFQLTVDRGTYDNALGSE